MNHLLEKLYYEPDCPSALGGVNKLYPAALHTVYASFFKRKSDIGHAKEQARYTLCMPRSLSKDPT